MKWMKWVVVLGFLVAFSAGAVVGVQWHHPPRPEGREPSWLAAELDLTSEQSEQMRKIWVEGMRGGIREQEEHRRRLRKERDEAIAALIRPEDKAAYQAVLDRYTAESGQLDQQRSQAFESAVQQTKQLLNERQLAKYEEILKKRQAEDRSRGRARHPETRPGMGPPPPPPPAEE